MRLQDLDVSTRFVARVVQSVRLTPPESTEEVRDIALDVAGHFPVRIGQNFGVLAPGQKEFGQPHHLRLYTVADVPSRTATGDTRIHLCVKRCWYVDPYNGERYNGVASHFLCDLQAGDQLTLTGPYGQAFEVPEEKDAALILIGAGTGIAPFRAFVNYLFRQTAGFHGRVWLLHGARTGLELLYMNDVQNDFAQYYDNRTFEALAALSSQPHWSDSIDWHTAIGDRSQELWRLLADAKTYVYVAGLEKIRDQLDSMLSQLAGSPEKWQRRKAELIAGKRWVELLY
ncbi:MAG: hypothetical protein KF752_12110 [Pirellulaceae bacterium]|nr:hypothetical protein [Pirellulaceae bacterium]